PYSATSYAFFLHDALPISFLQCCVAWLHLQCPPQVRQGIFVRTADERVFRQACKLAQRFQHLLWCTLEEPAATRSKQCVAAKQKGCAFVIAPVISNMPRSVARHI